MVEHKPQSFWAARLRRSQVTTHRASTTGYENISATTTLGYELPELYLAGFGLRAEITFFTSPLFLSYGVTPPVVGLAAAGAQTLITAKQREEQQRQEDE